MAAKKSSSKKSTAKSGSKRTTAPKVLDGVALLKQDHERVRELLSSLENATGARRDKLLAQVRQELEIHTTIEEEIFYPAYLDASRKKEDKKLYYEAVQEHHVVDMVMPEVSDGESPEELKAKAKVLKDLVEHHAEEEETEMFPRAKKVFDRDELRELGQAMTERREELLRGR